MSKAKTVTRTQMGAVEKEYRVCDNCDQEYSPDEMTELHVDPKVKLEGRRKLVWLNKSKDREEIFDAISVSSADRISVCPYCTESLGVTPVIYNAREFEIETRLFTGRITAKSVFEFGMVVGGLVGTLIASLIWVILV